MILLKNAGWLTGGRLTADVLSAVLFVAISRRFGPADLGTYSYGFAIAGFVLVVGAFGIEPYGVREYPRASPAGREQLLARLLTTQAWCVAAALAGATLYLAATRAPEPVVIVTLALAAYQAQLAFAQTIFVPASASEAMREPAIAELLCRGGAVVVSLLLLTVTRSPLTVIVLSFPVAGAFLIAAALASAWRRGARTHLGAPRGAVADTLNAVWPIAASEFVYQVFNRADLIMLTLLAGSAAAGFYASGFKFVEVGITPMIFLASAVYPRMSQLHGQEEAFGRLAARLLLGCLAIGGLIAWALLFVVPAFVVPLFGDRFAGAASIVQLMAGLAALWAVEIAFSRILLAAHRQAWVLRMHAVGAAINVALNLLLIRRYGVPGAVLATVVALAGMAITALRAGRDLLPARMLSRILWGWCGALLLAAGAGAAVEWISHSTVLAAVAALATLVLAMAAAGAAADLWGPLRSLRQRGDAGRAA